MASLKRASPLWLLACCIVALSIVGDASIAEKKTAKTKVTSVGWSGSGLMLVYHIAVFQVLKRNGLYKPGQTVTAGSSGGAYTAFTTTVGVSAPTLRKAFTGFVADMVKVQEACMAANASATANECNPANGNLAHYARLILEQIVPTDAKALRKANGTAFVHITTFPEGIPYEPYPYALCGTPGSEGNLTVSHYVDREDAIRALLASSFISYASNANCSTTFRNYTTRDGGYSQHLPCPPGSAGKHCLKVDAMWMPDAVTTVCPAGVENPNGPIPPNIYPGLSGRPIPGNLTFCEWQVAILSPMVVNEYADEIWDLAQADAKAWLKANGWPSR